MGPQINNVGDELGREARSVREDLGDDRRQSCRVRLDVALPAAGGVDLREVGVANPIAVSFDRRHIERRAGAQEDGEDVRMSSIKT